ncbi:MAG: hypothetical protein ACRCY8_09830, partial [Dermatophilaceae bacterium]
SSLGRAVGQASRDLDKLNGKGKGFGAAMSAGAARAKSGLAGLAGSFGGLAVAAGGFAAVDLFGDSIAEARESQKVSALTASAIKATGGAAKVTADQVGDLAGSLSRKTGIDDEVIQSGSNLLLTFKNIKNEAGKGNDVFNQATAATLDLSKAGFGSVESASKGLGKALNDPVKGITALGKAGVTFTEAQKKQIKTMVKSGDTLGAQKIILAEIEAQVGGAAAATATAGDKAKVTFDNLKESAGTALLPVIDRAQQAFVGLVEGWQAGTGAGGQLSTVFQQVGAAVSAVVGFFVQYQDVLLPIAAAIAAVVVAMKVWTAVTTAYTAVQAALNLVMAANPIGLVVLAIVALVAGLVIAYKKSETFRNIVNGAWSAIKTAAVAVFNFLKTFISGAFSFIKNAFLKYTPLGIIISNFGRIKAFVTGVWNTLKAGASAVWSGIKNSISSAIDSVNSTVAGLRNRVVGALRGAAQWLYDSGRAIIQGLVNGVKSLINRPAEIIRGGLAAARRLLPFSPAKEGPFSGRGYTLYSGRALMQDFGRGIEAGKAAAVAATSRAAGSVSDALSFDTAFGESPSASSTTVINVNVTTGVGDKVAIGREVATVLEAYRSSGGRK